MGLCLTDAKFLSNKHQAIGQTFLGCLFQDFVRFRIWSIVHWQHEWDALFVALYRSFKPFQISAPGSNSENSGRGHVFALQLCCQYSTYWFA